MVVAIEEEESRKGCEMVDEDEEGESVAGEMVDGDEGDEGRV